MSHKIRPGNTARQIDWQFVLQSAGFAADTLKDVASLTSLPPISVAVGLLASIIETCQAVKDNTEAFEELKNDASSLVTVLFQSCLFHKGTSWPPPELLPDVESVLKVLTETSEFAESRSSRSLLSRIVSKKLDPGKISSCRGKIQSVLDQFKLKSHLTINLKLSEVLSMQVAADVKAREEVFLARRTKVMETLNTKMAHGASYDSSARQDVPKCLEDTRQDKINKAIVWMEEQNPRPILWVHSPAGFGKTTLAQTICEKARDSGHLGSSFFWSRSDPARPTTNKEFAATVAYQLCQLSTSYAEHVILAVEQDPAIFSRALPIQMERLVFDPLLAQMHQSKYANETLHYILLVADGLDECEGGHNQQTILKILLTAIQERAIPLRVLLCSRYEPDIKDILESDLFCESVEQTPLDRDYPGVTKLINTELATIRQTHPSRRDLPSEWPMPGAIASLLDQVDGSFIYASVVMKFVGSRDHLPSSRLTEVINLPSSSRQGMAKVAFATLDDTYNHLLRKIPHENTRKARDIFSWMITPNHHIKKTIKFSDILFGFDSGETRIILKNLASVLDIPDYANPDAELRFFHASFADLLKNHERLGDLAGLFWYDYRQADVMLSRRYIAYYQEHDWTKGYQHEISTWETFTYTMEHSVTLLAGDDYELYEELDLTMLELSLKEYVMALHATDRLWWSRIWECVKFLFFLRTPKFPDSTLQKAYDKNMTLLRPVIRDQISKLLPELQTYLPLLLDLDIHDDTMTSGKTPRSPLENIYWESRRSLMDIKPHKEIMYMLLLNDGEAPPYLAETVYAQLAIWLCNGLLSGEENENSMDYHVFIHWIDIPGLLTLVLARAPTDSVELVTLLKHVITYPDLLYSETFDDYMYRDRLQYTFEQCVKACQDYIQVFEGIPVWKDDDSQDQTIVLAVNELTPTVVPQYQADGIVVSEKPVDDGQVHNDKSAVDGSRHAAHQFKGDKATYANAARLNSVSFVQPHLILCAIIAPVVVWIALRSWHRQ